MVSHLGIKRLASILGGFLCVALPAICQPPFWFQTSGPEGGLIFAIAVNGSGIVVAGGERGTGAYRSTDGGASWLPAQSGLVAYREGSVYVLAASPAGDFFTGAWRSQDGGANWTRTNLPSDPQALAISSDGTLFGGVSNGVLRSSDGFQTWQEFAVDDPDRSVTALGITPSGQTVYAGTEDNGVYKSLDRGQTWGHIGLEGKSIRSLGINVNGDVFVGTRGDYQRGCGPVLRSRDQGAHWEEVGCFYWETLGLTFNASGHIFAGVSQGTAGVWRSIDGGDHWEHVGLATHSLNTMATSPDGTIFAAGNGGGIFRSSDNGATWVRGARGLTATDVQSLLATPGGDIFAGADWDGVYRSSDHGQTWTLLYPAPDNWGCCAALARTSDGDIFVGPAGGLGVHRSTDGGNSWTALPWPGSGWVTSLAVDQQQRLYASSSSGLFRSDDRGATWQFLGLENEYVRASLSLPTGQIYALSYDSLWRSLDGGGTWQRRMQFSYIPARGEILSTPGGTLFFTMYRLYRSTDGGESWQVALDEFVQGIAVHPSGRVFAAVNEGPILSSSDEGATWTAHDPSRSLIVHTLVVGTDGYLYGGVSGAGVWRSTSRVVPPSLGPARVWVGLKNSDDQGTQFDLRVELYKNSSTLLASGETRCITGITRNPNLAKQAEIAFQPVVEESPGSGDQLSFRILTRIGTNPDGTKCSGPGGSHNNATGLRLYFDSTNRPSRFGAEVPPEPASGSFLHFPDSFDTIAPTAATPKYKDSSGVNFAGGNAWRQIGTWNMVVP